MDPRGRGILRFGLHAGGQAASFEAIRDAWQAADELGFDSAWVTDHFIDIAGDHTGPFMESWTSLAALAALTKHIRVGTMVTGNTFRNPGLVAKMAATVDHVSGGRLELGMGAAWFEVEHHMYGIPFPTPKERLDRLEEALQVILQLWSDTPARFEGRYYRLRDAVCFPKPVQKPRPPLLVAGTGEKRALRIVARYADHWNDYTSPANFRRKLAVLHEHCAGVGRDFAEIEVSVLCSATLSERTEEITAAVKAHAAFRRFGDEEARAEMLLGGPDALRGQIAAYADAGVHHIILSPTLPADLGALETFAREVIPAFRK